MPRGTTRVQRAQAFEAAMRQLGASVVLRVFRGTKHELTPEMRSAACAFLSRAESPRCPRRAADQQPCRLLNSEVILHRRVQARVPNGVSAVQNDGTVAAHEANFPVPIRSRPTASLIGLASLFDSLPRYEYIALGALLVVLLATRLVGLGTLPDTLNPDEADNMQSALRVLHGSPPENGFFGFDWYGEPGIDRLRLCPLRRTVRNDPIRRAITDGACERGGPGRVLRADKAPGLGPRCADRHGPVWLATVVPADVPHGLEQRARDLVCVGRRACALLKALDSPESRRGRAWFAVCGVCCALTLYGYPVGRLVLPSLFALLPLAVLRNRQAWRSIVVGYVVVGALAVVLFLPVGALYQAALGAVHRSTLRCQLVEQARFSSGATNHPCQPVASQRPGFLGGRVQQRANALSPGEPLLDRVTGVLVAAGAVASLLLRRFRSQFETWLWWTVLLVGWFVTEVLPSAPLTGLAPQAGWQRIRLCAFGSELLIGWAAKLRPAARGAVFAAISVGALAVGSANLVHYVEWHSLPDTRRAQPVCHGRQVPGLVDGSDRAGRTTPGQLQCQPVARRPSAGRGRRGKPASSISTERSNADASANRASIRVAGDCGNFRS